MLLLVELQVLGHQMHWWARVDMALPMGGMGGDASDGSLAHACTPAVAERAIAACAAEVSSIHGQLESPTTVHVIPLLHCSGCACCHWCTAV